MERDINGNWLDTDISEEDEEILDILEEFGY